MSIGDTKMKKKLNLKGSVRKGARLESQEKRRLRLSDIIQLFIRYYPDAHCALDHENPEQLLIATILSAQCTDERVNQVTKRLFVKYPFPQDFALAELTELEQDIRSTGFFRNKARNIQKCCQLLIQDFGGKAPPDMEKLVRLPGVGRKTANVVLGNAFGISSGIVVDTHVTRLGNRLGLVAAQQAEKIERELMRLVPQEYWILLPHWLIWHGRRVCRSRKPNCEKCFLFELCPRRL